MRPRPPSFGVSRRRARFGASSGAAPCAGRGCTPFLGAALLPLIAICALTGFLSHLAYIFPDLGDNSIAGLGRPALLPAAVRLAELAEPGPGRLHPGPARGQRVAR